MNIGIFIYVCISFLESAQADQSSSKDSPSDRTNINSTKAVTSWTGRQFYVSLKLQRTGTHICGGSLLGPFWVLTAAHCKIDHFTIAVAGRKPPLHSGVVAVYRPAGFRGDSLPFPDDIALAKLRKPIRRRSDVWYVKLLPNPSEKSNCEDTAVVGFGRPYRSPAIRGRSKSNLISARCSDVYESFNIGRMAEDLMCTKMAADVDEKCFSGDSGGPVVCGEVQYGVTNWALKCREEFHVVYTKIDRYLGFINRKTALRSAVCKNHSGSGLLVVQILAYHISRKIMYC